MDVDYEAGLSYDDEAAAEYTRAQAEVPTAEPAASSLQSRIGTGRLYLLSESAAAMNGRLRQPRENEAAFGVGDNAGEDEEDDDDEGLPPLELLPGTRDNAIMFSGEPIANLPTQRIFAYASNLNTTVPPLGLEWVNDTSFVLVWKSSNRARRAFLAMREAGTLDQPEDEEGYVPAKPVPETLWPMDMRLEKAMGRAVAAQAIIRMRWARPEDVKSREARNKSKFYERYGENAGKEGQNTFAAPSRKRGRQDEEEERRRLDDDLDRIGDGTAKERRSASPPHRRRRSGSPQRRPHDRRGGRRRTEHGGGSQQTPPAGTREWDIGKEQDTDEFGRAQFTTEQDATGRSSARRRRGDRRPRDASHRSEPRPTLSKMDLDAELDAFLGGRS